MEKHWESLTRRIILESNPRLNLQRSKAVQWELLAIEGSDLGDEVTIITTITANTEEQAAQEFRKSGYIFGEVRRKGEHISRSLDLILKLE